MFVSILQLFVCRVIQLAGEPLQSRADQNTRKIKSGGQPGKKPAKKRFTSYESRLTGVFMTGVRQTNQEIWQQVGPGRKRAIWPGSRHGALNVVPGQLSRGDTL